MDSAVEKARNWLADWEGDECRMSPGERRATEFARALLSSQSQLERMREALELVTMSGGWQYMIEETREVIRAALTKEEK